MLAQLAQLGQHALDQGLERFVGAGPLLAQATLALAGGRQQLGDDAHAAREAVRACCRWRPTGRVPRVVLGQVDEAAAQLTAQAAEFVEEVTAVIQQVAGTLAQRGHLAGALGVGAVAAQFILRGIQRADQAVGIAGLAGLGAGLAQRVAHGVAQPRG